MTDKIKLINHISLFHNYFSWEKKFLMEPDNLQEQKAKKDECSQDEDNAMDE